MLATFALSIALAAPLPDAGPGELVWWRPDAPASGLALRGGGVMRGLGPGRSEWWPLDGDPPRLLARTTPCPSVSATYDPPRARLPERRLPWGPLAAYGWSDRGCALTGTVAGPLVRYNRSAVAAVIPRSQPARLVAIEPGCTRAAVVDDDALHVFPVEAPADAVRVPLAQTPADMRLTDEAVILAAIDGGLTLYRPDGHRLAAIELGAPLGCAATAEGLVLAETVEGETRAYAMSDGALRWGRPAVDAELGRSWSDDPPATVGRMAVQPGGRWVAAVFDGRLRLWAPGEGRVEVLPGDAVDAAFSPDGARLAVRGPQRVTIWRMTDGAPRRGRSVAVKPLGSPDDHERGPAGATLAWVGEALVALVDEGIAPVLGVGGPALTVDDPRALVAAGRRLWVVAGSGARPVRVGRRLAADRARSTRVWPGMSGARLDCEARLVAAGPLGWRTLDRPARPEQAPPPVRLCAPGGAEVRIEPDQALAVRVTRRPGQPPTRRETQVPLLGEIRALDVADDGAVTALLDGRAITRWRPGGGLDRVTWVVVEGRDVVAGGGRVSGSRAARRALGWWTPAGLIPATEAPSASGLPRLAPAGEPPR